MDMRTPLKKVRGLGSSKEGTHHFWMQRMTAVALVPLFIVFILFVIAHLGASYETVVGSLANPFIAVLMGMMVIAGLIHMRIGMQEVIDDYVHNELLKLSALMANNFFTVLVGGFCLFALLKIAFVG
ncbi:succinate dehydrogenase, hydrophobic membrane anchor protein [Martelella lutilitoris]|uniref:Succinate dehydrogenase hydrophobic membrane anchor subunit n=1 Tax=Martelella lutilitoris TaxID=2583532 RepID=A0A5C4JPX7_9HYPH|nr:succinate dehydrogenase, hydrophobic membrane anchor protein [Martelella lutilitoris]TNB47535.1 succinate dehydrogenase, hydrophobic membrane anchor protein [Martelella lutilitoris]